MTGIVEVSSNVPNGNTPAEWPGIVSRFQLVILATHRNKQLLLGAQPRIAADRLKQRNTSIALEELKRGLILFKQACFDGKTMSHKTTPDLPVRLRPASASVLSQ